jgi:serine/threonine protein phosphatase 1
MRRTLVIGDIHGCFDELSALLELFKPETDDRVVAVGDLSVKGPKSREVLDLFMTDPRFSSVIGNHDYALVKHFRTGLKLKSSQARVFEELRTPDDRYLRFLESMPFFLEIGSRLVVHAGLRPGVALEDQSKDDLTELRTLGDDRTDRTGTPWYEEYDGPSLAVFGHWPSPQPRRGKFALGIDSGCVYGYELTGYILESEEFLKVQALKEYAASPSTVRT